METILLAIAAGSLIVALVMSVAAWRLARAERARASARVAALAAAATTPDPSTPRAHPAVTAVAPTGAAPAVAPTTALAGARVSSFASARPGSIAAAARASELAMYPAEDEVPLRSSPPPVSAAAPLADSFLGAATRERHAGPQRILAAAAVVLLVVLGSAAYWLMSRHPANAARAQAVAASTNAPLELVSLRHERQGRRLTLSGLVRNPSAGATIEGLNAVVFLFDAQGGFISSARAEVDFKRLTAGDESPFVVTVDAPSHVARYRVSFRTDAGVVTHVDRRGEQPPATALASGRK